MNANLMAILVIVVAIIAGNAILGVVLLVRDIRRQKAATAAPLPDDVAVRANNAWAHLVVIEHHNHRIDVAPGEARAIAGALLRTADEVETEMSR